MVLDIEVHLEYDLPAPVDLLVQIEAAPLPDQHLLSAHIETSQTQHFTRVAAEDDIGTRIWLQAEDTFQCNYTARVQVDRPVPDLGILNAVAPHLLPGETVRYLMPSRYCPSDEFQTFVAAEFGGLQGGARIAAINDWIADAFSYVPGVSNAQTTAIDSFVQRQGICRDFAHVMIALARASTIPARFASVYAPDVTPQDFHAVAEVYLDGAWHLVDPTGMATPDTMARIGVGADAADVAFLNVFGQAGFVAQSVSVARSKTP
ncbi:transglutaminase family protein [uncultured Tateyamaria sp.]|uniref:transglutaminase-like domain-containing protein n=1 Tax=uncultured Tateyamaria sp. TaxID=455651 RepID=UPI00260DAE69|nr:transglutaminase family protein [uncultured Tateyamaria sp.]